MNASNGSLSSPSDRTAACDWQMMDKMSSCFSWEFSFSNSSFLAFFLAFLCCVFFSSTANGLLFFLTVRYKKQLRQPRCILNNMSACGVMTILVVTLAVLSAVAREQTQTYGYGCIAQFCALRCFFLTSQMTLALMAVERYIFICHGIHYPRLITTSNIRIAVALIWLVSVAVSSHGGFMLSQIRCGFQQQTGGLLCDASTIKEHITFSWEEDMLVFGPPSVIMAFCVLAICYCFACIYRIALKVSKALKLRNRRANRTAGCYFLMFVLQLALNVSFIMPTVMAKKKPASCMTIGPLVTPLIIITPPFITAAFLLIWHPQIKRLLFSKCRFLGAFDAFNDRAAEERQEMGGREGAVSRGKGLSDAGLELGSPAAGTAASVQGAPALTATPPSAPRLLFSAGHQKCQAEISVAIEVFQRSESADSMMESAFQVEQEGQVERENTATTSSLPGPVFPSASGGD